MSQHSRCRGKMFILFIFCHFFGSLRAMDPASCSPGQTEVVKLVKFNCVRAGQIDAVSCMDPLGNEVTIGHSTRNDHFQFMCERDNTTVRFLAIKCLNADGTMLQLGDSFTAEDGQRYQCERAEDGGLRLERTSVSRLSACQYNGSSFASGRSVQIDNGATFVCNNNGQRFQWQYQKDGRCVAPDATNLTINQVHSIANVTYKCVVHGLNIRLAVEKCNVNGQGFLGVEKIGDHWYDCSDSGLNEIANPTCDATHQLKDSWTEGTLEKRCEYRNGQTVIVDIACINNGERLNPEEVQVTNATTNIGIMCKREKNHALTWRVAADWEVQAWLNRQQGRNGVIDPFMGFGNGSIPSNPPPAPRIGIVDSSITTTSPTSSTAASTSSEDQTERTSAAVSPNATTLATAAAAPSALPISTLAPGNETTSRVPITTLNQTVAQSTRPTTPTVPAFVQTTSTISNATTALFQTVTRPPPRTPTSQLLFINSTNPSSSSSSSTTALPTTTVSSTASASASLSSVASTRTQPSVPLTAILSLASSRAQSTLSTTAVPTTTSTIRPQPTTASNVSSSTLPSTTTIQISTTSTATTTTESITLAEETSATTAVAPEQKLTNKCEDANHDIVFVLDQSGRFGSRYWETARSLMHNMTRKIGTRNTRYALVTFSDESNVKTRFNYLNQDQSEVEIQRAIDETPHGTAAKAALEKASELLRDGQSGRFKTVVYIADEQATDGDPKPAADSLRDEGAVVFALGVGNHDYRTRELREIASPKSVGFLKNYENMVGQGVSEVLSNRVCSAERLKNRP